MSLRRREFIAGLGGAAISPLGARAQRPIPVVGFINGGPLGDSGQCRDSVEGIGHPREG